MNLPKNYETTSIADENKIEIAPGAHKLVIKNVVEGKSKSGLDMLTIFFDLAPGEELAGVIYKKFHDDTNVNKKWPHIGTNYCVVDESTEYGVRNLKTFVTCVEKSNSGFKTAWGIPEWGKQFVGKFICGVFGEVENEYNGNRFMRSELRFFRSTDGMEKIAVPSPKMMGNNPFLQNSAPANPTSFMEIPDGIDEEVPFN